MLRRHAFASIHLAALLFGLTGIFGELIQASAMVITAGRATFAVIALLMLMTWQGIAVIRGIAPREAALLGVAGGLLACHWVTFFIAVKVGGIAIATLGFASFPALITLFERLLFRERIDASEWVAVAGVTAGLILLTPSYNLAEHATLGLAWALVSGLCFALFAVTNRRGVRHVSPYQLACWENLVVALIPLPWCVREFHTLAAGDWMWLALLGIFCTALSHYLLVRSLTILNARSAGIVIALEPVYAIILAAVLFEQYPSVRTLLGGLIVISAIIWAGVRRPPRTHQ